ncbi:exopolysaccharide production repressor protein [Mesorhizobium sp. CCNWLW179-1]|uniref:exopolysaccharide production repressor protein n=1 Tax=Mesorhizobium sp. CCNWLW179-1 TaxID=3136721 RepID=UPI003014214A
MSLLLFLRGLVGVLVVFAITTYVVTQSLWTTFIQTVICAILLQIGYFAAVLFMVWRSGGKNSRGAASRSDDSIQTAGPEEQPSAKISQLPGVSGSQHP